uniref:7TM_GPCR_Srx domain-containing protein n=1 Tax=Parastrongyloides trichosuri TaxID=131310 RepID=A0A0N4ZX95_PARTI
MNGTLIRSIFTDLISITLFTITFTSIGFIIERSVALIYYYKYEFFCNDIPYIGIILIVISWICGVILRLLTRLYQLDIYFFIFASGSIQISSQIICFCIIKTTKKQYTSNESIDSRLKNKNFSNCSIISIRYQTIENKKIIHLMKIFITTTSIMTTLDLLSLAIEFGYILNIQNKEVKSFIGNVIPYLTATIVPLTVIIMEEKLRKNFLWILRKISGMRFYKTSITPEPMIRDSKIRAEINMTNDKLNDIYFLSYANQWK